MLCEVIESSPCPGTSYQQTGYRLKGVKTITFVPFSGETVLL
jgi:hypothetical protein